MSSEQRIKGEWPGPSLNGWNVMCPRCGRTKEWPLAWSVHCMFCEGPDAFTGVRFALAGESQQSLARVHALVRAVRARGGEPADRGPARAA